MGKEIQFYTVSVNLSIGKWVVSSEWKELDQEFKMSHASDAEKLCGILNRQANIDYKKANRL